MNKITMEPKIQKRSSMTAMARYFSLLFTLCLAGTYHGLAQGCTSNFSVSPGPGGTVMFYNLSAGTSTNTTYNWAFGNFTNSVTTTTTTTTSATYTNNGTYTVSMTMINSVTNCTSTSTQTFVIN